MKKVCSKYLVLIVALIIGKYSTKAQTFRPVNQGNSDSIGITKITISDIDTSKGIKVFAINQIKPQLQDSILKVFVTNGYWSWEVTSNTEANHLNMRMAKLKFKEEHPEIFLKIACDKDELTVIKNDEFLNLGPEIKEYILSHPDQFTVLPKN